MKNKKKEILLNILIILVSILIVLIILINNLGKKNENKTINAQENLVEQEIYTKKEKYEYNEFYMSTVTVETLLERYFNKYKSDLIYNIEGAYNTLNKEYREKKFENLEEYKQYINENLKAIMASKLQKYSINKYDEYTEYVCLDNLDNYYIIDETSIMQYSLILDNYTINLPEITKKYDNANIQEKVVLNIEKFMTSINNKDYKYAYNCLSSGFKTNNFETLESFKEYMQNNFTQKVKVEYNEFKNEGEIYIYNIALQDILDENKKMNMQIIMQLQENRNFIMSFSIK